MVVDVIDFNLQIYNKFFCFKFDMIQIDIFKVLCNVSIIIEFGVDGFFSLSNGYLVLRGIFKFIVVIGNIVLIVYDVNIVIIDEDGNVIVVGIEVDFLFGNEDVYIWYGYWKIFYKYIIDEYDGIDIDFVIKFYCFNNNGLFDDIFVMIGIIYIFENVVVDCLGCIYIVSYVYDDGGIYKYCIDCLNDDGIVDIMFNIVYMSKIGNGFF